MIEATFDELNNQGTVVASGYLWDVVDRIDRRFGDGYAREHPELVAAFMQIAGREFCVSSALKVIEGISERLASALRSIARTVEENAR